MSTPWWRDAAIYQIYPRSFRDTNADGEGDLAGIIEGLPYLKRLGVDAIWLSPFFKSPNRDGGYDVADPRLVDPRFGDNEAAERLIAAAHDHGLKIIFDVVPNHFSSDHIWFQEALAAKPGSPERARFHFYEGKGADGSIPPNNWNSVFGGSCWTRITEADGSAGQWYLHLFDTSQPDLNWENPEVAADFEKTLRFWLDRGVDGFRVDVAHGLVKEGISVDHPDPEGLTRALRFDAEFEDKEYRAQLLSNMPFFDREGVHDIYRAWRKILDSYAGDRMAVAEAFISPSSRIARYVRPDELHQSFNFDFMLADWSAAEMRVAIQQTSAELSEVGAVPTWVLNNHDSSRVVSRLGDEGKARALALLTHALPGGLYVYQGEELGLPDGVIPDSARQDPVFFRTNGADKGRDGARVPLPWKSAELNLGFSTGEPWLPLPSEYGMHSVDVEELNPHSMLNFYRTSLGLRKSHPDLGARSELTWLYSHEGVLSFKRGESLTVVANTTEEQLSLPESAKAILLASNGDTTLENGVLTIPSHSTVWLTN